MPVSLPPVAAAPVTLVAISLSAAERSSLHMPALIGCCRKAAFLLLLVQTNPGSLMYQEGGKGGLQAARSAAAGRLIEMRRTDRTEGERITVALIPAVAGLLRLLQERTNLSKTDITNRAITTYEFLDQQLKTGRDLIVRDPHTGESLQVRFL